MNPECGGGVMFRREVRGERKEERELEEERGRQ